MCASDILLKENIQNLEVDLNKFMELNPVIFEWKGDVSNKLYRGLIAQDIEKIYPERVISENGTKKIVYSWDWIIDIIKILQMQQKEISVLKAELCLKDNSYSWC